MALRATLGIVVVHFGRRELTLDCLASVASDPSPVDRHVVVVDNSGSFEADPPGARLIPSPDNPGFGAAVNRGIDALEPGRFDAYVILNNDILLLPGYLEHAAKAFLSGSPELGAAAGPLYLDSDLGKLWYAGGGIRLLTGTVSQQTSPAAAQQRRFVRFIPGAALAVRPSAWREVGGFDPSFFLYNEDVDLCLRLWRSGWRLLFHPGMAAVHRLGGATGSQASSPLYLFHLTRNRLRPYRPLLFRMYLGILHSGYVMARVTARLVCDGTAGREQARALLRGHWEALRLLGKGPTRSSAAASAELRIGDEWRTRSGNPKTRPSLDG